MKKDKSALEIAGYLVVIAMLITTMSIIFVGNYVNREILKDTESLSVPSKMMVDTDVASRYNIRLSDDKLILDASEFGVELRTKAAYFKTEDIKRIDPELELYTIDDFGSYLYITYTNDDMTKLVELAVFADIPDGFDYSTFGISVEDAESSESGDILVKDTRAKESNGTVMALSNIYDEGYIYLSMTGLDVVKVRDTLMGLNTDATENTQDQQETQEAGIEKRSLGVEAQSSVSGSQSDSNSSSGPSGSSGSSGSGINIITLTDSENALINIVDAFKKHIEFSEVGHKILLDVAGMASGSIMDTTTQQADLSNAEENPELAIFYSKKDSTLRVCNRWTSEVYFRISNIKNPAFGMDVSRLIETEYKNVYTDIDMNNPESAGYGYFAIMTDDGMYAFKETTNGLSSDEVMNEIIKWAGITVEDAKIVSSEHVKDELASRVSDDILIEAEKALEKGE